MSVVVQWCFKIYFIVPRCVAVEVCFIFELQCDTETLFAAGVKLELSTPHTELYIIIQSNFNVCALRGESHKYFLYIFIAAT